MLNKIWTMALLCLCMNLHAFSENGTQLLEQVLAMENIPNFECELISEYCENQSNHLFQYEMTITNPLKFESTSVKVMLIKGTLIHVADYNDKTRVATCLDGEDIGLQAIAINGMKTHESTKVKWRKNYFTHKYPHGKVTSYPTKQTIELKPNLVELSQLL